MEDDCSAQQRQRCYRCRRRRLIGHHMTILVPLLVLLSTVCHAMCPTKCQCNDETLHASCSATGLQVVPIQLNPELKHINLSHNKINSVHFTLQIYENLITLDLSYNKIQKLGSMNFISQIHMNTLNLSNNNVESLEKDVFKGLKSLIKLDLSSNKIENITPNSFNSLLHLEILLLNNNKLLSLESELLKHQSKLRALQLDDNQLLEIPTDNLAYTSDLERLSMARNLVEYIEESSLTGLKHLRYLSLIDNVIFNIHNSAFDGCISLETLNLALNNLTNVPTAQLSKLSNLLELDLSGTFITYIPPVAFRGLFKLRHLHLNRLEKMNKIDIRAFVDNINLELVSMNDNIGMETIPTRLFHGNPKLTQISMKNNLLETLEATHFPLDQLVSLKIGENPLNCNCSLMWLWKLVTEQRVQQLKSSNNNVTLAAVNEKAVEMTLDVEEIVCAKPEVLSGVLLADTPESDIRCAPNWLAVATGSGTAFFVLAIIFIALIYSGILRRCSTEKNYHTSHNESSPYQTDSSDDRQRGSRDKCEHIIGPPLLSEYQTLPPWDNFPRSKDIDLYKQFGYHSNSGHSSRPHIVYV